MDLMEVLIIVVLFVIFASKADDRHNLILEKIDRLQKTCEGPMDLEE